MRRLIAVPALSLTAALALAAPADAVIELDRGMAGIALGMPRTEVEQKLGPPTTRTTVEDGNGGVDHVDYYKASKVQVLYDADPGQELAVRRLTTRRGIERTPERAGVGTPERVLRRRVRGLRCSTIFGGQRLCATRGKSLGEIGIDQTQFFVSGRTRRVSRVIVGRYYD